MFFVCVCYRCKKSSRSLNRQDPPFTFRQKKNVNPTGGLVVKYEIGVELSRVQSTISLKEKRRCPRVDGDAGKLVLFCMEALVQGTESQIRVQHVFRLRVLQM